jgi:predicted RNA methylase
MEFESDLDQSTTGGSEIHILDSSNPRLNAMRPRGIPKFHYVDSTEYSLSHSRDARDIANLIGGKKFLNRRYTVVDANANAGGNTFGFASSKRVKKIWALEIDPTTCSALKANVDQLDSDKVEVICGDATVDLPRADVVFYDPPWGGPSYLDEKTIGLPLSGIQLHDVILGLKFAPKLIVVKAPKNFNIKEFRDGLRNGSDSTQYNVTTKNIYKRKSQQVKYIYVFVQLS